MPESAWTDTTKLPERKSLQGDITTDVLIIGGGMCGVLCAYFLHLAKVDYLLVEGKTLGNGITKNTTAKITSQHGLIYDRLIKTVGTERATQYLRANELAIKKYRELAKNIDCDFEEKSSYVYSRSDRQKIEKEIHAVNSLGFPAEFAGETPLPFEITGAIRFPAQAQFHPMKFLMELSKPLHIYEHTFVRRLMGHTAYTEDGTITAKQIIITTHFPFLNRHGSYFMKLYQQRSYVLALERAANVDGMYIDEAQNGLSFRNAGNLLLLGGGGHRTGHSGGGWLELRKNAENFYPNASERYHWATQDCMSLDGIPYIGRYSACTPNLFAATGFNKWGMTSSMVAAMRLSDMITHKDCSWGEVFSPSRNMLKPQLFYNLAHSAKDLLTPGVRRCPHMGCKLHWNKSEHTWDCPCHGSRFEKDGNLIDNPAQKDAKVTIWKET